MKIIYKIQFGSHIYGTNVPTSDHDYKAIFMPDRRDIIMGTVKESINQTSKVDSSQRNTADDVDMEMFSFKKYINLLVEGQTVAMDMFFTPEQFYQETPDPLWFKIKENKKIFLSSNCKAAVGYCLTQSAKYGQKGGRVASARAAMELFQSLIEKHGHLSKCKDHWDEIVLEMSKHPHVEFLEEYLRGKTDHNKVRMLQVCNKKIQEFITLKEAYKIYNHIFQEYGARALMAEKNEGLDFKALMHAVRVLYEVNELLCTGNIIFPRPERDLLLKIRKGEMPYKEIAEIIEEGMELLKHNQEKSILPAAIDMNVVNDFIFDAYEQHIYDKR